QGLVSGIVEHKDALKIAEETGDSTIADITEINSGIYAFDGEILARTLAEVTTNNVQGEKYLTDVLVLTRAEGGRVDTYVNKDLKEVGDANDRTPSSALGPVLNRRIADRWMRAGVIIVDPATT